LAGTGASSSGATAILALTRILLGKANAASGATATFVLGGGVDNAVELFIIIDMDPGPVIVTTPDETLTVAAASDALTIVNPAV
jgi:hypothetical protein